VTKLNSEGNDLVYSTYLGGSGYEYGYGLAVDASGYAYITGYTYSTNFPTEGEYQTDQGTDDVFVTKLDSSGSALVYSTYLGGNSYDQGYDITIDASGNAYVTGNTTSTDFPTENPFQSDHGGGFFDVFVAKLNNSGNSLAYSTYLGGDGDDHSYSIEVDSSYNAYLTGFTLSSNFPTKGEYQTGQGNIDAFVTKLNSAGNDLVYSTYLGGNEEDYGRRLALDASGNAYITGYTHSFTFPTEGEYQTNQIGVDAFVTKLNSAGNSLVYSTYLGGSDIDYGYGITVDASGNSYIIGETNSPDFPTEGEYQAYQNSYDVFVIKIGEASDVDNDWIADDDDNCLNTPNPNQQNSDNDSHGDECDNCPDDDNEDQADGDGDNVGYICDNCPDDFNPDQSDIDGDNIGDVCENCCLDYGTPGDEDKSGAVNLTDILDAVSYVYVSPLGEPQAEDGCNALYDVNGDGAEWENPIINLADILDMISHVYVEPLGEPVLCCPPGCSYP